MPEGSTVLPRAPAASSVLRSGIACCPFPVASPMSPVGIPGVSRHALTDAHPGPPPHAEPLGRRAVAYRNLDEPHRPDECAELAGRHIRVSADEGTRLHGPYHHRR